MTYPIVIQGTAAGGTGPTGPTLQEAIDTLPVDSGGEIVLDGAIDITEPVRLQDRSHVTIRGRGVGISAINARLTSRGPAVYLGGTTGVRLVDLRIQGISNVECGVLACRTTLNGRGASNALCGLNVQGDFAFAAVAGVASENFEIRDCRLETRLAGSVGWWTAGEPPLYSVDGLRGRRSLAAPGPVCGGTNSGVLMHGRSYIVSTARDVVSIHVGQGSAQVHVEHVFISNSPSWHPDDPPVGRACIRLDGGIGVILDGINCESPDCWFGLHVSGLVHALDMRGCRIAGRQAVQVDAGGGLIDSRLSRTNSLVSFADPTRPVRIVGQMAGTMIDVGSSRR